MWSIVTVIFRASLHFLRTIAVAPRGNTVYAGVVCLRVCVCVCLSHSGVLSKRLNIESRKQRHTIAIRDSNLILMPKISTKFDLDHPHVLGRQMQNKTLCVEIFHFPCWQSCWLNHVVSPGYWLIAMSVTSPLVCCSGCDRDCRVCGVVYLCWPMTCRV